MLKAYRNSDKLLCTCALTGWQAKYDELIMQCCCSLQHQQQQLRLLAMWTSLLSKQYSMFTAAIDLKIVSIWWNLDIFHVTQ